MVPSPISLAPHPWASQSRNIAPLARAGQSARKRSHLPPTTPWRGHKALDSASGWAPCFGFEHHEAATHRCKFLVQAWAMTWRYRLYMTILYSWSRKSCTGWALKKLHVFFPNSFRCPLCLSHSNHGCWHVKPAARCGSGLRAQQFGLICLGDCSHDLSPQQIHPNIQNVRHQ